jgi:Na+/proline symporter
MKAVIWTDLFQGVVMLGGLLAIVVLGIYEVGGVRRVLSLSEEGGRLIFHKLVAVIIQHVTCSTCKARNQY